MRGAAFAHGLWAAAFAVIVACQAVVTLEAKRDVAVDAGDEHVVPVPTDPCGDLRGLDAPPRQLEGAETPIDLVLGYVTYENVEYDGGLPLCRLPGFDLDGRDTCNTSDDTPSCSGERVCDELGGIDNSFGNVAKKTLERAPKALVEDFEPNVLLRRGLANLMMHVSDYNGEADDAEVHVDFYASSGIEADVAHVDGGERGEAWDGESLRTWYVETRSVTALLGPRPDAIATGHVRNRILKLTMGSIALPFRLPLVLYDAQITGELRRLGDGWHIVRGRLGGYIDGRYLMKTVASFGTSFASNLGCEAVSTLGDTICKGLDHRRADAGSGPCDAITAGFSFVAVPALRGPVRSVPYAEDDKCADAGITLPCLDQP